MKHCTHCGQPVFDAPPDLVALIATLRLPGCERRVAEKLLERFGRWTPRDMLVTAVWTSFNEPEYAGDTVCSHVSKLKAILLRHGWTIEAMRNTGYRLAVAGEAA